MSVKSKNTYNIAEFFVGLICIVLGFKFINDAHMSVALYLLGGISILIGMAIWFAILRNFRPQAAQ